MAITLLSTVQAIDLRHGGDKLGVGTRPIHRAVRAVSPFVEADRALDVDIAAVAKLIELREIPVLQ